MPKSDTRSAAVGWFKARATRRVTVLALVAVIAAGLAWWRLGRAPEVAFVAPWRGTAVEIVYATGAVEPARWAKVTSLFRGRMIELCYCEGKQVAKGDVLARLDDAEQRAQLQELKAREEFRQARAGPRDRVDRPRLRHSPGARAHLRPTCARSRR